MPKFRYYPLKPETEEGFKKAVAWFGGRDFIASLKGYFVYTIYGEKSDPRSWMKPNVYPELEEKLNNHFSLENDGNSVSVLRGEVVAKINEFWANKAYEQWNWKKDHFSFWEDYLKDRDFWKNLNKDERSIDEFWFDYISDTGDGQMGVYSVACLCLADLWLDEEKIGSAIKFKPPEKNEYKKKTLLPRGSFLFIGGDTAYHNADYTTLFERFQSPFRWAFISVRKYLWENYDIKKTDNNPFKFATQAQLIENILDENSKFHKDWDGTFVDLFEGNIEYYDTEPLRPLFGIPANHDYYDAIGGFNKQFRRPPFKDFLENSSSSQYWGSVPLKIHSFSRHQEASYVGLQLPFEWWMFGIDSELEEFDYRQRIFFQEIVKKWNPRKLIMATPEPTTVFGIKSDKSKKTAKYLHEITKSLGYQQPFLNDGRFYKLFDKKDTAEQERSIFGWLRRLIRGENETAEEDKSVLDNEQHCRLDLSGDIHHYARYWGPIENGTISEDFDDKEFSAKNYASLVAGGGGAFFDSTDTLIGEQKIITKNGEIKKVEGEVPPLAIFPGKKESVVHTADKIFDLWNIKRGGYVQIAGCIIAVILFLYLTLPTNLQFALLDATWKLGGWQPFLKSFQNQMAFVSGDIFPAIGIGVILFGIVLFLIWSGSMIGSLAHKLETTDQKIEEIEDGDGRLYKLLICFLPMLVGLCLYIFLFLPLVIREDIADNYAKSWFLLYHLIFAGILVWVAMQYGKWLSIRTRLVRGFKNRTLLQKLRDPLMFENGLLQGFASRISREYTIEYLPDSILLSLAVLSVVFGLLIFGQENLFYTATDLVFIITFFGGFMLIALGLGMGTGGSYHKKTGGKLIFLLLGTFHAILQLLTPFVLIFYGSWIFLLIFIVLSIIFNGFSKAKFRIEMLLDKSYREKGWRSYIWKVCNFKLGAEIMKTNKRVLLTTVWVLFGLTTILTPLILTFVCGVSENQTVNGFVTYKIFPYITNYLKAYLEPETIIFIKGWLSPAGVILIKNWLPFLIVLVIVGYTGYRTSRIWLSWYLGTSLAFNGHNNEVGGLARIEDYKQILRIRVREDGLTVFVIGIEEAKPDLNDLDHEKTDKEGNIRHNIRLVDKFDLKYQ